MIADFSARVPTLWHGEGIAPRTIARLTAGHDTLVIADSAVPSSHLAGRSAQRIDVDAQRADVTTVREIARQIVRRPPRRIVAVGGGSVLDASKIAALVLVSRRMLDYAIGHASRSALTVLPDAAPAVDLLAVPTTLGTSSETNSVGVLENEHGYRLIVGRALRPRHALLDPRQLSSLPSTAVTEGALEAFLRVAGASTSPRRTARACGDARVLGRELLVAATRDSASAAGRLRLARLSAATQRTSALRGGDPFSARHWYLANEVAFRLGVRKMVATAAVVSAVWGRIGAGDSRWGDARSLARFWTEVAGVVDLPVDPAIGIAALVERWRIPRPSRPADHELRHIALATERAWGNRRPMLPGLVEGDFHDVLRDSRWSSHTVGAGRRPLTFEPKEVK
ncbi:L-1,2-propanediol oxidoreductase [Microbacterium oxydans]|uniref:L-1,2-propanediol oxidoreductase n=1 Tax=Microbacterium oxydans TaxID=82380 RepID=A0A0F0L302_9MICO|nr:daptide-type RiPP biosynthesis dehydogenase [Microbacterium oxydans]KJL25886.1 L-1,2-propanediol oxidoreductase [Microbacterium oxydans]